MEPLSRDDAYEVRVALDNDLILYGAQYYYDGTGDVKIQRLIQAADPDGSRLAAEEDAYRNLPFGTCAKCGDGYALDAHEERQAFELTLRGLVDEDGNLAAHVRRCPNCRKG